MNKAQQYINNILSDKVNHGKWIKRLCEWHQRELTESKRYTYDQAQADKYVKFIELLEFTQGKWAGNKFLLQDWQAFFISMMFGWVDKQTGLRRFKQVTLNVPKKNGKTELGAAIALACSYLDKDERGQIFMAATTQDQAAICFNAAKAILNRVSGLGLRYTIREHRLIVKKNQTYIRYISSEAGATEGKGASVVIFDEEHLQVTNELRDNLKSGMGAREQPLFISISTAGTDKNSPYYQHIKTCKKIIDGLIQDDSHLVLIYEAPEIDGKVDWENPNIWKIANPNWGVSVLEDNFIVDYTEAKNEPNKQPNFITKKLNIWADSAKTWIDSSRWASLGICDSIENYYGKTAYIGLDLGSTGDFSALAILIPNEDRTKMRCYMKFYIPEDMANKRTRADQLNFRQWANEGYIKLTPGNATDYNYIKSDILQICENFDYKPIAFDKALASMFMIQLYNDYSIEVESFSQSVGSVTAPTKQMYEWIMNETLIHDNNPVMAWMISNVEVYQDDANGNYKIHKGKSKNKVDGPCALVNAIGRALEDWKENPLIDNYVW
jgi:phage terminase large subunit-like protein